MLAPPTIAAPELAAPTLSTRPESRAWPRRKSARRRAASSSHPGGSANRRTARTKPFVSCESEPASLANGREADARVASLCDTLLEARTTATPPATPPRGTRPRPGPSGSARRATLFRRADGSRKPGRTWVRFGPVRSKTPVRKRKRPAALVPRGRDQERLDRGRDRRVRLRVVRTRKRNREGRQRVADGEGRRAPRRKILDVRRREDGAQRRTRDARRDAFRLDETAHARRFKKRSPRVPESGRRAAPRGGRRRETRRRRVPSPPFPSRDDPGSRALSAVPFRRASRPSRP